MLTRLKIHIWGGFGSQLFGLAYILDLHRLGYSYERMCVVFHEAGVTKRNLVIQEYLPNSIRQKVIKDFKEISLEKSKNSLAKIPIYAVRAILVGSKIVVEANSTRERVKPWTLSCRGHYRYRYINPQVIAKLFELIFGAVSSEYISRVPELVIHFRLGDLIGLKQTLSSDQVIKLAKKVIGGSVQQVRIFVEKPTDIKNFPHTIDNVKIIFDQAPVKSVVKTGVLADYFIGSDSKISIWIVLFRLHKNRLSHAQMPETSKNGLETILGSLQNFPNLEFFR